MGIDEVKWYRIKRPEKTVERHLSNKKQKAGGSGETQQSGKANDFEDGFTELTVLTTDERFYREFRARVDDEAILQNQSDQNFYQITFSNKGGLVSPIIIEFTYKDGTKEVEIIPAEIWRMNENVVTKVFVKNKEVVNIVLDPHRETADTEADNNFFPKREVKSRFDQYKENESR